MCKLEKKKKIQIKKLFIFSLCMGFAYKRKNAGVLPLLLIFIRNCLTICSSFVSTLYCRINYLPFRQLKGSFCNTLFKGGAWKNH